MTIGRPPRARREANGDERADALARFLGEIAAIASVPAHEVRPESQLIADLGLDALAFGQLGLLHFETYHVKESTGAFKRTGEEMTVEMVFDDYVLAPRMSRH